ncbi:hypothetical protein AAHC03_0470 [Spirometra sp. Aus1]
MCCKNGTLTNIFLGRLHCVAHRRNGAQIWRSLEKAWRSLIQSLLTSSKSTSSTLTSAKKFDQNNNLAFMTSNITDFTYKC